jgi:two-component system NtrC family sensor kinase
MAGEKSGLIPVGYQIIASAAKDRFNAMNLATTDPPMSKELFYRPFWLTTLILGTLLLIALGLMVSTASHSLERLERIRVHLSHLNQLQQTSLQLEEILDQDPRPGAMQKDELQQLRSQVGSLIVQDGYLSPDTHRRLHDIQAVLTDGQHLSSDVFTTALGKLRKVLAAETEAHSKLLREMGHDTAIEFRVSTAVVIAFPLLALLLLYFLRRRILLPLRNLGYLMTLLGQQDYRSVPANGVDGLLQPLFDSYNHLVGRLAELEKKHQDRQQTLEKEVWAATEALLDQHQKLARAERLAAVGEVAAGLAHELRNPLAGIQMALTNLRRDLADAEQAQRLDLVIAELKRLTRLLNDLLSQARQTPEPSTDLLLTKTVSELLTLVRYQVPPNISLEQHIPQQLRCRLPEGHLRQALLNLLLNAAQGVGEQAGAISVSARQVNGELVLSVCDDGPGLPPALLNAGVQTFTSWREGGTGLGLAMVRRFVHDQGGRLELTNRQPHGACVALYLPCKETHG